MTLVVVWVACRQHDHSTHNMFARKQLAASGCVQWLSTSNTTTIGHGGLDIVKLKFWIGLDTVINIIMWLVSQRLRFPGTNTNTMEVLVWSMVWVDVWHDVQNMIKNPTIRLFNSDYNFDFDDNIQLLVTMMVRIVYYSITAIERHAAILSTFGETERHGWDECAFDRKLECLNLRIISVRPPVRWAELS